MDAFFTSGQCKMRQVLNTSGLADAELDGAIFAVVVTTQTAGGYMDICERLKGMLQTVLLSSALIGCGELKSQEENMAADFAAAIAPGESALEPEAHLQGDKIGSYDAGARVEISSGDVMLTEKASSRGYYRWDPQEDELTLYIPRARMDTYTLRWRLKSAPGSFWTFQAATHVDKKSSDFNIKIRSVDRDAKGRVIRSTLHTERVMPRSGTRKFSVVNIGIPTKDVETSQLILDVMPEAEGVGSYRVIKLSSPRLHLKKNFLHKRLLPNYLNMPTLRSLNAKHKEQLKRLYVAGHRRWVIHVRGLDEAQEAVALIEKNPHLRQSQFLILGVRLASRAICNEEYYRHRVVDGKNVTFAAKPAIVRFPSTRNFTLPDMNKFVRVYSDCAMGKDHSQKVAALNDELSTLVKIGEVFGPRLAGYYLFDEASSIGVPRQYTELLYRRLTELDPKMPIMLSHNAYIAQKAFLWNLPANIVNRYYSPDSADVYFFDFYTTDKLRAGDTGAQVKFLDAMNRMGLLSKPFVKLVGTGIKGNLCASTQQPFLELFQSIPKLMQRYSAQVQRNYFQGFWGFYNAEAVPNHSPEKWVSTLAHQSKGFCPAQFEAVVRYSSSL